MTKFEGIDEWIINQAGSTVERASTLAQYQFGNPEQKAKASEGLGRLFANKLLRQGTQASLDYWYHSGILNRLTRSARFGLLGNKTKLPHLVGE